MSMTQNKSTINSDTRGFTFLHWFSLIFTIFSLYLLGDAFYRWDAYRFHSSFAEYMPNVALAFVVWSVTALLGTVFTWLPLRLFEGIFGALGVRIKAEHFVLYLCLFILITGAVWAGKKQLWPEVQTSAQLKLTVIAITLVASIPLAWLLRNKAMPWLSAIRERITPLVWIFVIALTLSILLVGYYKVKGPGVNKASKETSQPAANSKKLPNILLVSFDTMRAQNMSVYGYDRDTTPFIKKWAETASVFTRTQAESNYTAGTTPSMMSGRRTWTHRKYHHDTGAKPLRSETENIALELKKYGYKNYYFMQNHVATVDALGMTKSIDLAPSVIEFSKPASLEGIIEKYLYLLFADSFSTYNWIGQDDFIFTILLRRVDKPVFETELPPELVFNRFLDEMDNTPMEPFFAWIHIMPPHEPQLPPPPFAGTFNPSSELRSQGLQHLFNREIVSFDSKNLPWSEEVRRKVRVLRDYYDEFILYCDSQFKAFISEVEKRSWSGNTVIILSSDHGESFEHDYFLHKPTHLYEQVTHIPLIIREPGQSTGRIIDDLVEQVDMPATMLDLAGIPLPSWMEGRSLIPLMRGETLQPKNPITVSLYKNSSTEPITKGIIAVWEGDYKLIHYLDKNKTLLFNLKEDPAEMNNLFNKDPDTGQRLLSFLKRNLKDANDKIMAENN